ncbi:hypothetical protein PIB30_088194 [Stylosanthes scabra]|uniref:Uncharacterized protein n=1 Tax=Stylosanthes scabra TaxID=79078 RepID=A0ABU6QW16_9FABA|nr:hypothetical protein [Stylosanthes scabra]
MAGIEEVLSLLDSYWFETTILTNKALSKLDQNSHQNKVVKEEQVILDEVPKAANTLEFRSFSDQNLGSKASALFDSPSPNSVLTSHKLRTIPSGKDVREFALESSRTHENEHPVKKHHGHNNNILRRRRFRNRGNYYSSKSLTELEFQELKGFMDLGFVFTEEDKDSRLVSLIPGLQRLGREEENKNDDEVTLVSNFKPYLSEAWDFYEQREIENNSLLNWRVPAMGNENDMKHNLKSWAHTVASIVR